jgi:F-type H+-transporting ATPase subunit b
MTEAALAPLFAHARLLSAAGGVEVDINPTLVLLQLAVVTGLMLVLKPLLFDPMLALFEEREKRVDGARAEARKMDDEAASILRKYETEIDKVRRAASEERDKVRAEAQKIEARELAEARRESAEILETGRAKIADEASRVATELSTATPEFARSIASRVLGREVS